MLEVDVVVIEDVKNFSHEPPLAAHHVLVKRHNREIAAARNSRDNVVLFAAIVLRNLGSNECARVFRLVCVSDVNRNVRHSCRINRILMQNARAHIRKFSKFLVGNRTNLLRIFDDSRVRHEEARNIGPVFIHIRMHCTCHKCSRYVRSASGECLDFTVRCAAVKSRKYRSFVFRKFFRKCLVGLLRQKSSLFVELYQVCRIHKIIFEKSRHKHGVEIFAPRCDVVCGRVFSEVFAYFLEILQQVNLHA